MDYLIAKEPEKSDYLIEPEPETPAQPQGLMSKAKDTAVSFGIGANSLLQMAGDFYGLATGDMGNVVSQQAKENIQYLQQRKSPELRQAEEARRKAIEADEDELGKALTYVRQTVTNPSLLSNALAEQVPNLVGTGGAGALAKAGAEKVLLKTAADQAAKRLAAKKAAQIGTGAAVGAGAAMQGTDVGADLYDEAVSALDKITDEQAMSIPEIASLMEEKEATLDEAKTAFALALGREAFALGATVSAGAQMLPGGRTIERAFVGKQAGRRLAGAITGGLGEAASEAVEEGGSRVAANLLARQFEPDRPLAKGVGEAVGQAAVVGGIPGAAFGAASSRPTTQPAPEGQTTAGKTGEAPASAATKSALAGAPEVALESSEGLTPEQFYAAVNIRQARLMGGEPDPEDIRIAGEVPLPKVQIDPEKANRAIEEAQSALQEWADSTANAPQNIRIIFDPELLHNGYGVQGYYSPDGSIAVNAAFVTPDRVASIARHEWAHQTLATPEGQQAFANFVQREIPQSELDALATRYRTQDRRKLLEEWIAENQEKAPGVIERIVARIREWLAGVGIVDLSDAEVADIMLRTLRQQAENQVQPDTSMGDGGAVPVDPNAEAYNSFIGQRTEPKMSLQRLPTAGDVVDANGNLKYTVPQKTLDVSHYSNIGGLTEIDPAFYGTGRGQHYHRMMKGINKSFFFVGNSKPRGSENVSGKGMTRYRTSIDSSRIYNMDKDPLSLWFAANPEKSEGMLKELGYDGFLARTDDNRTFVALFYPTNLETGELNRTVAPEKEPEIEIDEAALAKATAKYEREQARRLRRALSGKFSLTEQPKRISGVIGSPSVTDINYDRAKRNLTSANQARFKSQISEYAPEAEIFDAVGDWVDGSENSVAAIFQDRKSGDELQRLAAQVGLAGDQKAVLWWRTEPEGADAIHEMIWPKGVSMDEARQAMIDVGLENRTLIQTPEGVRGFVFDQGRKNLNKIEALNEHETQPSLESSPAAGDFLGSWTSRAEGRRAYRRVLGSTPQTEARAGELRSGEVGGVGDSGQPETRFSLTEQVAKGRDTVLAAEAQKLRRGETTAAKYARKVEQRMPLRPFDAVPEPATDEDILRGLANRMAGDRLKRELRANPEDIEGQQVEARLDIPSYEDANVWTVTLHLPRERADSAGKVLAYTPTAILRDVTFTVNETAAMKVAAGARKSSFATMDGTYVPATARSAYEQAVEAKESGDWVEIGMNPIRHSYFYDKADQRPVVSAEEVIQVGGLVLGRGVQYGEKSDRKFSLAQTKTPEFKRWFGDSKIVDADGNPQVMYHGTSSIRADDFTVFEGQKQKALGFLPDDAPKTIFFTPDPEFASGFSGIPNAAVTGSDTQESEELASRRPGARVYPVFIKAENPFDYNNPDHVDLLFGDKSTIEVRGKRFGQDRGPEFVDRDLVEEGRWQYIEMLSGRIKAAGFDSFYVREAVFENLGDPDGEVRNIAVFEPTQIKSATGNTGAFDPENPDIRYSLSEEPAKKPLGERALEDSKATKFKNQKGTAKYLGDLLKSEFPEGLDRMDSETAEKLADLLDRELSLALTMPDNANAIGWYGREMEKVVEILRSPELNYELDNPVNRGVFNALLAITSNGQEVVDQFLKSAQLYEKWKKTGKIPSLGKWGGERNRAMAGQIKFLNQMLGLVGAENTVGFLTSESSLREHLDNLYGMVAEAQGLPEKATVAAKEAAIGKYLNAGMPTGELKDYNTVGAIVFGPKLGGGFFANLYGKFDRLTMDRWFMRTFHRLTGRLGFVDDRAIQGALDEARRDLGAVEYLVQTAAGVKKDAFDPVSKDRLSDSDLLAYIKAEGKKAFKNYREINAGLKENPEDASLLLQDTLRRTYNRIIKAESGLFDAPDNGSHRVFIRDVLNRVQQQRAQRGEKPIDTSDIQAILWYLEKDIWDKLKDKKEKTQDELDEQDEDDDDSAGRVSYSNGAVELYRRKTGNDYVFKSGNQPERAQVLASD